MSELEHSGQDFSVFAQNVRRLRASMNIPMKVLADRAGIGMNTLARIQRGEPCFIGTQRKIADAFDVRLESLWRTDIVQAQPFYLHRDSDSHWSFKDDEEGRRWPLNDTRGRMDPEAIQNPEERIRLGRNGLSSGFISTQRSLLRSGLYVSILIEVYGRIVETPYPGVRAVCYRCLRGALRFNLPDSENIILSEHESLFFDSNETYSYEPAEPLGPRSLPPLLFGVSLSGRSFSDKPG